LYGLLEDAICSLHIHQHDDVCSFHVLKIVFVHSLHVHEDDGVCSLFVRDADDGVCRLHVLEDDDLVCITILEDGVCSLFRTFTFLSEAFLSGHAYTGKQQRRHKHAGPANK
jgi:hypothetical protein